MNPIIRNVKCRNSFYSKSAVNRFPVPDEFVSWSVEYAAYKPILYESDVLIGKPWADPKIGRFFFAISFDNFRSKECWKGSSNVYFFHLIHECVIHGPVIVIIHSVMCGNYADSANRQS